MSLQQQLTFTEKYSKNTQGFAMRILCAWFVFVIIPTDLKETVEPIVMLSDDDLFPCLECTT